jgi:hypothetical protein
MQTTIKVEKRTKGGKDALAYLRKELEKLSEGFVTVGIHKDSNPYPDGTSTAEVASIHEFGDKKLHRYISVRGNRVAVREIPERAPIRTAFRRYKSSWSVLASKTIPMVAKGKIDAIELFEIIGQQASNDIKSTIRSGLPPGNQLYKWDEWATHSVREDKGPGTIPLIDTGHLINSMSYHIGRHDGGEND